jgi:hypothetical protein
LRQACALTCALHVLTDPAESRVRFHVRTSIEIDVHNNMDIVRVVMSAAT